ncbi:hypothetical protein BDV37DRAFT_16377 [Aspergillus pseudonomiae]|uniref:Uncharacterized protein n=1 Tax=Aspergillus pseudonomiae TaxID=1506151 RepID=A0A5N7CXJ2_9EURO|nr:uncharacterized protein BDV37DRAFT_16377 [Aspergillus pseudonomiae]KAE8398910.1 hypothetical protein BDV37DRAFT_16377 [Aspergillus pseudonomiae]
MRRFLARSTSVSWTHILSRVSCCSRHMRHAELQTKCLAGSKGSLRSPTPAVTTTFSTSETAESSRLRIDQSEFWDGLVIMTRRVLSRSYQAGTTIYTESFHSCCRTCGCCPNHLFGIK